MSGDPFLLPESEFAPFSAEQAAAMVPEGPIAKDIESREIVPPEPPALTVAELIAKLKRLPPDAQCIAEGCDCYGDCVDVYEIDHNQVLLARHLE